MNGGRKIFGLSPRGDWFSPRFLLWRALALVVFFVAAHLAGLREYTAFLSLTPGAPGGNLQVSAFLGMIYIGCYFGVVIVAPIFVLAAGLVAFWRAARR